jgi:hypothetical protein
MSNYFLYQTVIGNPTPSPPKLLHVSFNKSRITHIYKVILFFTR